MPNKIAIGQPFPDIRKSVDIMRRGEHLIPALTQTLAKGPGQYSKGVCPVYAARGKGSHIWDVDGNEYLDYVMAVGPLSLGYCYPAVDDAVRKQLEDGITYSLMHPLEVEVAELIREVVPNAEMVRYAKSGADVTSASVRLARAYTGRSKILCCGYHGWHDWYIGVTDRNRGIPKGVQDLTFTFSYNDISSVIDSIDDDIAGIILEPMVFEEPRDNFLHELRSVCDKHRIVLIFDEMWTGFRFALGGAQEYFGVKADLVTYSKAIANGMPIAVLAGRGEIMSLCEKDIFFFTTFGGEALSLAAAKATIGELRSKRVPDNLATKGARLQSRLNDLFSAGGIDYLRCIGAPCRTLLSILPVAGNTLEIKTLIQQELLRHGILWNGFHTMSYSHSDAEIDHTIKAYSEVIRTVDEAVRRKDVHSRLRGEMLEPVFRRTGNFNLKPKAATTK